MYDEFEDDDDLIEDQSFVRPFIITGGRSTSTLPIEVMVSSVRPDAYRRHPEHSEYAAILRLCTKPHSVAEVSALCKLPLGVIRVLVSDLVDRRELTVASHEKLEVTDELAFLDRIIAGVEQLA